MDSIASNIQMRFRKKKNKHRFKSVFTPFRLYGCVLTLTYRLCLHFYLKGRVSFLYGDQLKLTDFSI